MTRGAPQHRYSVEALRQVLVGCPVQFAEPQQRVLLPSTRDDFFSLFVQYYELLLFELMSSTLLPARESTTTNTPTSLNLARCLLDSRLESTSSAGVQLSPAAPRVCAGEEAGGRRRALRWRRRWDRPLRRRREQRRALSCA